MKLDLSNSFDLNKAETYFEKLKKRNAKIELKQFFEKRTIDQNSYLHVCFTIIANETGYTIEETKVRLKRIHGSFMVYEKEGERFLRSTADLDTLETTMLIDWLREFANDQLGAYIPTPDEYIQNQFEIQKQLQHVK